MPKRKEFVDDEVDSSLQKFPRREDSDEDYDDQSVDGEDSHKYEILKEDDIEGQEEGGVTNEGDIQITPFNMQEEMEEGHFDSEGMYHWNKETEVRDNWLENIDWVKIKETNRKDTKQESDSDDETTFDEMESYEQMLQYMKEGESVIVALKRLGGNKSLSASERLKLKKTGIAFDKNNTGDQEAVSKLTEIANLILTQRGNMDIYQETFEEIKKKTDDRKQKSITANKVPDLDMYANDFDDKEKAGKRTCASTSSEPFDSNIANNSENIIQWEFKRELNEEKIEGPYSTTQMNKWVHDNTFKTAVWVRKVGDDGTFYSSKRIDFELYL